MYEGLTWFELAVTILWFIVLAILGYAIRNTYFINHPGYRYFLPGLIVKMLGAVFLGLAYEYLVYGGDTIVYYVGAQRISKLWIEDPMVLFEVYTRNWTDPESWSLSIYQNYVVHMPFANYDAATFFIPKVFSVPALFAFHTYYGTAVISAAISYIGVWMIYDVFVQRYPHLIKLLSISILFYPSTVVWGSGILKDSITLCMLGVLFFSLNSLLKIRTYTLVWILLSFIAAYMIFNIKAYILYAFLPFAFYWFSTEYAVLNIKISFVRFLLKPLFVVFFIVASVGIYFYTASASSTYNPSTVIETAQQKRQDLVQDYYYQGRESSRYDIGDFDPSVLGLLSKFPIATWVGIYGPHPWQAHNAVAAISSLESTLLLLFTFWIFFTAGPAYFFRKVFQSPFLFSLFFFSIFFFFITGLVSGNFGNLVRYRIPALPFFVSILVIVWAQFQADKKLEKEEAEIRKLSLKTKE